MDVKIALPDDVLKVLGPNPEREAFEGVLLLLVGDGRMSLTRAGAALGLDREQAARWYTQHTLTPPDAEPHPLLEAPRHVQLDDLTQEELDRSDRFLDFPPAKQGSGLSDVSIEHDKYLAGDTTDELPKFLMLEDLTQEELDQLDRPLNITPAKQGSGLSDVSVNHDKYLAEDE